MGKDLWEWRKKHGKLVKGWRKILQRERTASTPYLDGALGRALEKMGEAGRTVMRCPLLHKGKPVSARIIGGGLPSLGKKR